MARQKGYLSVTGRDWIKARTAALIRDDYKCQAHKLGLSHEPCQAPKRKLCVHHIIRRVDGGTHDLDNLITVCYEHHCAIHPHLLKQMKLSLKRGYTFDAIEEYDEFIIEYEPENGDKL